MVAPVISADVPRFASYTATDGQTDFPIPFAYLDQEDVRVDLWREGALLVTYTGGFGVLSCDPIANAELVAGVAGTATLPPCQAGDEVTVYGLATPEREASYTQAGEFRASTVNREMNRRVAVEAELRRDLGRAPQFPIGAAGGVVPSAPAYGLLGIVDGEWRWFAGEASVPATDFAAEALLATTAHAFAKATSSTLTVPTYAALVALSSPAENVTYNVLGYTAVGDGAGGRFAWTGTEFVRLERKPARPQWAGAVTGDTGNQAAALNTTIANAVETYLEDGTYRHSAALLITDEADGKIIRGASRRRTFLKMEPGTEFTQIGITSSNVEIRDLAFQGSFDPGIYEPATTRCAVLVNNANATKPPIAGFRAQSLNFYDQNAGAIFVSGGVQGAQHGKIKDIYGYRMKRYGAVTLFKNVSKFDLVGITTELGGPCLAGDDGTDGDAYLTGISSITKAAQAVVTRPGHDAEVGDWLYCDGIGGMTELNGNSYEVVNTTTDTVTLNINTSGFGTYTSGGYMTSLRPLASITIKNIRSRADGKYMGVGEGVIGYSGLQYSTLDDILIEDGGYEDHTNLATHRAVRALLFNAGQDGLHPSRDLIITGLRIRRFASQPIVLAGAKNIVFEDWEVENCWGQNADPGGDCPVFSLTDDAVGNSCDNITIGRGKVVKQTNSYANCLVKNSCTNAQNVNVEFGRISLPSGMAGYVEGGQTSNTRDY